MVLLLCCVTIVIHTTIGSSGGIERTDGVYTSFFSLGKDITMTLTPMTGWHQSSMLGMKMVICLNMEEIGILSEHRSHTMRNRKPIIGLII